MSLYTRFAIAFALALVCAANARADENPSFSRKEDVIYGRKYGAALTLDVFAPKKSANGLGLIYVVSGGWVSSHGGGAINYITPFTDRGYTVFAVSHACRPKFTIPEILADMHRATRFVRLHANEYGVDPDRLGIYGASAGGHLSLMQGVAGDAGTPNAKDPVDRVSSRVQAVACFYPPTDFLNYGRPGYDAIGRNTLVKFKAAFDFHEFNGELDQFVPIVDEPRILEIGRQISPITHVTADDPPMLLIHGDMDTLVPMQQSESFVEKLKGAGVEGKLIVKPGAQHGWPDTKPDVEAMADWFDEHLKKAGGD